MKKIIKAFLTLFFVVLIVSPFVGNISEVHAGIGTPTPAAGDGCLPDTGDPDCVAGCEVSGSAGLIPCGKSCDDPDTAWEEDQACTLCHGILMSQLIIEFLVKLAGIAAMIAIAIGGFLYMFAAGKQGAIDTAKSMIKNVLIGFIIVFIAWALIDTVLTMFGYIDPIGGEWYEMDC
ncbi:MAG: hypothetical protein KAS01_00590 [Candidatus Pacebacteria bacterium]|nr:hypothetical protein [Candidatus Paceibacterota bacterium]